jgi:cell shape-determining protein MreC
MSLGGVVLFLIVIFLVGIRFLFPGFFITLASPLWRLGTYLSTETRYGAAVFQNPAALMKERDTAITNEIVLENENQILAAKVAGLTQLLGTRVEAAPGIVAGVLARPPVAPYDILIVDQGTAAGVEPQALVYGPGGIPIGTVTFVTQYSARITLYSSSGISTPVLVGQTHMPLVLTGAGAGAFDASAPRESGILVGDNVYAGGPGALPIGTISSIDSDPASPTEVLHVHPFTQPFSLTWVTISTTATP